MEVTQSKFSIFKFQFLSRLRYVCFSPKLPNSHLIINAFPMYSGFGLVPESIDKFTYFLHSVSPNVAGFCFFFFWILHCAPDFIFQGLISLCLETSKLWPDSRRWWSYQHALLSKWGCLSTLPKLLYYSNHLRFFYSEWSNCHILNIFLFVPEKKKKEIRNQVKQQPKTNQFIDSSFRLLSYCWFLF